MALASVTKVRRLDPPAEYQYNADADERTELDTANLNAARETFQAHIRAGGSALAKLSGSDVYKNVNAFPENATEIVLMPRVAGG